MTMMQMAAASTAKPRRNRDPIAAARRRYRRAAAAAGRTVRSGRLCLGDLAGEPDLLDHGVAVGLRDDPFEIGIHVAACDEEAARLRPHRLVLVERRLHGGNAAGTRALAHERRPLLDPEHFTELTDP